MAKIKDSKQAINKLAKKIKAAALQLKTMRAELKEMKEKAKQESIVADKPVIKKMAVKKAAGRKPKKATGKTSKSAK